MTVRFLQPVYDGEEIELRLLAGRRHHGPRGGRTHGDVRARRDGRAAAPGAGPLLPSVPAAVALPDPEAPPAGRTRGRRKVVLGTYERIWTAQVQATLLAAIGEQPASLAVAAARPPGLAHPGGERRPVPQRAARPVDPRLQRHHPSRDRTEGEQVSTRGSVTRVFERKGHDFVELDVVVVADGAPAWSIRHVAIYRPRPVSSGIDDGHT